MKKFGLSVILLSVFVLLNSRASAEIIEVESKVTKAIVYTNSAQITRQAEVKLKEGLNEVIFSNIPENLNESTLTISAKGKARAKILDAKIKKIFLERPQDERVRQLEDEIQELEDIVAEFGNQQSVLREEREFLKSVKLYAARQIPEDLVTRMPAVEELDSLNSFLKERWQDTYLRESKIKKELRGINEKLEKLRNELAQLRRTRRKEKRIIGIELEVEKAGPLTVSVDYLIYQANWHPEYDARVDYEKGKIELACLGVIKQTGGEDWRNIELALSTAKPTISGRMPDLRTWILRPYRLRREAKAKKNAQLLLGFNKLQSRAPVELEALKEEVASNLYAQAEEKLTSVNYKIARLVDIKSNGSKHKLPVFSQDFSAKFQYSTTPKLSPFAYLVAKVTNEREQLLPAAVRIFLDDTYVGSSTIDAIAKGEEFDLYLGIDEGVKVKREKLKEETKEVWIAGIKRKNKIVTTTYKITVENYKPKEIKVNLFDHIPVSPNDQVVVKVLEVKPEPDEEDYEDRKGVMRWELDIAPGKKKQIIFTYRVEYPRSMNIGL